MPTYKLGRECVATLPGVTNTDVQDVTINVQGTEIDVTVFKDEVLTQVESTVGLSDVTIDVNCTAHAATIGTQGAMTIAQLDGDLDAVVLEIKERVTPKGLVEYTVSYGVNLPTS
jgi:hypothetical protein